MINVGYGVTVLNNSESVGGIDGIGTYTKELRNQFVRLDQQVNLLPFIVKMGCNKANKANKEELFEFGSFKRSVITSSLTGLSFYGSSDLSKRVNLVHATDHYIPKISKVPLVATIMDAIPLSHPEWTSIKLRKAKNYLWVKSAHWADKIITISEFSKSEIAQYFKIPLERIDVVSLGVDRSWFNEISRQTIANARAKFNLPEQYFLSVGTIQPRKNIERLIGAYLLLPDAIKNHIPLVIIGREGWGCENLIYDLKTKKFGDSILWLQHVSSDDLQSLVKSAQALVYPSLFEGFGLPVLEAFAAGVPVITSNTTSLPEVAGDAAMLVNPTEEAEIASAMLKIAEDLSFRRILIENGQLRAENFSWEMTAKKTLNVYKSVLG